MAPEPVWNRFIREGSRETAFCFFQIASVNGPCVDNNVGDPRRVLGAPGTPLPEDIKDIDKIWGGL